MVWLSGILVYEKSAKVFQIPHGTAVKISAKSHSLGGGAGQISYQPLGNPTLTTFTTTNSDFFTKGLRACPKSILSRVSPKF